jgi:hypothetical protein
LTFWLASNNEAEQKAAETIFYSIKFHWVPFFEMESAFLNRGAWRLILINLVADEKDRDLRFSLTRHWNQLWAVNVTVVLSVATYFFLSSCYQTALFFEKKAPKPVMTGMAIGPSTRRRRGALESIISSSR